MSIRLFKLPSASTTKADYEWRQDPRITSFIYQSIIGNVLLDTEEFPRGMETLTQKTEMPCETHSLEFSIADLTMDPTQDLIVVSEYK